jgi:RNA polymerase sigma-70 factor, ECF subfamily
VSSSTARFYSRALASDVVSSTAEEVSRASLHRAGAVPDTTVPFKQDSEEHLRDEPLLARICDGDTEALASLFRRYARIVRAVALRILKDASEADDLLQDIFVSIHRSAKSFDNSKASVQFWIVQMTYRRAISRRQYLNSRHFYTRLELNDEVIQTTALGTERRLDASIDQRLAELDLEKMFSSLSEDQQKTLRLHFLEGYTLDEIATMLGQTKGNIRHHSFRGLERLRKLIFGDELPGTRAV